MRTYCKAILLSSPYKDTRASLRERIPLFCIPVKSNPVASPIPPILPPRNNSNSIWFRYAVVYYVVRWIRAFVGKRAIIEVPVSRRNDPKGKRWKVGYFSVFFFFFSNLWTNGWSESFFFDSSHRRLSKIREILFDLRNNGGWSKILQFSTLKNKTFISNI